MNTESVNHKCVYSKKNLRDLSIKKELPKMEVLFYFYPF